MSEEFVNFIRNRVSQPILEEPAPSKEDWYRVLDAASRAADHGNLKPWRFRVYEGEGRGKLGEIYWQHAVSEVPDLPETKKASFLKKAYRAPSVLLVYAHIQEHPKVPAIEQIMAVSAASQQVLLALNALGFGAIWRTGPACFTQRTKSILGLEDNEQIVGLIYTGTATSHGSVPKETGIEERLDWICD